MTLRQPPSAPIKVAVDFAAGVAFFALVAGCVWATHGTAFAASHSPGEPDGWLTTVSLVNVQSGIDWQPLTRNAAIMLLAVMFGVISAFNMAIARHLRSVANHSSPTPGGRPLPQSDAHTNY